MEQYEINMFNFEDCIYVKLVRKPNYSRMFTIEEFQKCLTEWIWKSQKYDAVINYINALSNTIKGDENGLSK